MLLTPNSICSTALKTGTGFQGNDGRANDGGKCAAHFDADATKGWGACCPIVADVSTILAAIRGQADSWTYHKSTRGSGSVQLTPKGGGDYFAVMLCCDGYTEISDRIPIIVHPPSRDSASVAVVSPDPHYAGNPITIRFSGATDAHDWIGVYTQGSIPGSSKIHTWTYHNSTAGNGTVVVKPNMVGSYFVALFCCDGYTPISNQVNFTVLKKH